MDWISDGRDEHFGLVLIVIENRDDVADQIHAAMSVVVKAADKWADEISSGFSGHNGLGCGEHQRHVHANTFPAQNFCGLQSVLRHRTLHDNVAMELCQVPCFFDHAARISADGLCAYRPINERANLKKLVFESISLFRDQGWVRRDPVQNAGAGGIANLIQIGSVEEEFHDCALLVSSERASYRGECPLPERGLK